MIESFRWWASCPERFARLHSHLFSTEQIATFDGSGAQEARLGQSSAQMTLDIYGHLGAENADQTRAAVDGVLGGLEVHLGSIAGEVDT